MRAAAVRSCVLTALLAVSPAAAQEFRFGGTTVGQVIQLPTLILDSVPLSSTTGTGSYRQTPDGHVAWCQSGFAYCLYQRSGATITTAPLTQDLELNAWGFGQGLRFYGQVRFRATGGDQAWPLAAQTVSTTAVYLEYDRPAFRARLGRQFTQNGLGYYNYDGLSALWRAAPWVDIDLYGGGALLEALNAPYTATLVTSVENPPAPNDNAWLLGARVRTHDRSGSSFSALFQLIDRNDNRGLYSERLALNGVGRWGPSTITGDVQADFATGAFNLAQARGQYPVARQSGVFLEARHFVPYFELWSIWSVFSPVGYNELTGGGYWGSPAGAVAVQLAGGFRTYQNADAGTGDLRSSGWRIGADLTWQAAPALMVRGGYHYDIGPGAAESEGSLSARWEPNERVYAGLFGTAFQTAYEYQQGYGTVIGGGVTAGVKLEEWGRVAADVAEYSDTYGGNAPQSDWEQFRASLRFEFVLGREPGYTGAGVVR